MKSGNYPKCIILLGNLVITRIVFTSIKFTKRLGAECDGGQDRTGGYRGGLKALLGLLQKLKPARARIMLVAYSKTLEILVE